MGECRWKTWCMKWHPLPGSNNGWSFSRWVAVATTPITPPEAWLFRLSSCKRTWQKVDARLKERSHRFSMYRLEQRLSAPAPRSVKHICIIFANFFMTISRAKELLRFVQTSEASFSPSAQIIFLCVDFWTNSSAEMKWNNFFSQSDFRAIRKNSLVVVGNCLLKSWSFTLMSPHVRGRAWEAVLLCLESLKPGGFCSSIYARK